MGCGLLLAMGLVGSLVGLAPAAGAGVAPPCATSGLVIWLNDEVGGGTAGAIYYKLELTNLSGRTCTLGGYPGVSAVDLRGRQIGAGAGREPGQRPRTLTLPNGGTAAAALRVTDVGALPACRPVTAAGLRVYPPGQRDSKVVPFPFQACSGTGRGNLTVRVLAGGP
jgi:hypothetical protein